MRDDRHRLERAVNPPALVRLHRCLSRLRSVLAVMNTGAHPDDEANGLLAALRFAYGMRIVIACSTRGEGGQNALGPERGAALGVLRTAEMEEAARRIDADVAWLGHGPDDPVHDFGFSKNGDDTFRRWGEQRIVERLVRAYRAYRPDIVIPTFLDVPGQHGHHRAMTRAAETAFALAADPAAFPDHAAIDLSPWQASKFYLPAWSGASYAYDDETPPPHATLTVEVDGRDPVTGLAYRQLGEWSRAAHASQGMGVWREQAVDRWDLHLKQRANHRPDQEADIRSGMPSTLADLADAPFVTEPSADALREAQGRIDVAISAFPDRARIVTTLGEAARFIEMAREGLGREALAGIGHRLQRKLREIDATLFEAGGYAVRAAINGPCQPGSIVTLDVHIDDPNGAEWAVEPRLPEDLDTVGTTRSAGSVQYDIAIPATASHTDNYPASFDPMGGNGPVGVLVSGQIGERAITIDRDLEDPFRIVASHSVTLDPPTALIKLGDAAATLALHATGAEVTGWQAPQGWRFHRQGGEWRIAPPAHGAPGLASVVPVAVGGPACTVRRIAYPHIRPTSFVMRARLNVLTLDVTLPQHVRIGYVGAGSDHLATHMRHLGLDVTELGEADLTGGALSDFTTIVVGIFAFGLRKDLQAATGRLHAFVAEGGHLVTFYHRPTDGWNPDRTPPRRLAIGKPSVRWRVTDPAAPVAVLTPDHPLLSHPNSIGRADWEGWDKERGLYFAADYDPSYEELVSLGDPGESPLRGGLVSARIGQGRHTHVALALHHQMDKLVPGAFRLLANLVQRA